MCENDAIIDKYMHFVKIRLASCTAVLYTNALIIECIYALIFDILCLMLLTI